MPLILSETNSQGVCTLTLNDPENLNAMSEEMAVEFSAFISSLLQGNKLPKVLILTGAGRAFSAGGNLAMLEDKTKLDPEENRQRMIKFYESFLCILKLPLPIIAAINGHAVGAGLCLASACDIRIAVENAKLGFTFTKLGLHPGMGATYFLSRILGDAMARELLLTGRVIDAHDALNIGLVSKIVPQADLMNQVGNIVGEILQCGPNAVGQLLQTLRESSSNLEEALKREALNQSYSYADAEFKEGIRAAIEKRKPNF